MIIQNRKETNDHELTEFYGFCIDRLLRIKGKKGDLP